MIRLNNIKKVFQTEELETWALRNVNLEVKEGEFVAIMGPSGCGKSTLLNIIGLIDSPTEGSYTLSGKDVSTLKENDRTDMRKGKIGFVFQSFNLIEDLNVYENIELPLLYMGISPKERKERVMAIMDRMALSHRRKHFPNQLSGGQQQRVAIARAVIGLTASCHADSTQQASSAIGGLKGCLLLADEPTGNLDSANSKEVMDLLSQLHSEGATIIMVTHSQHNACYADRIVNLYDGEVVDQVEL